MPASDLEEQQCREPNLTVNHHQATVVRDMADCFRPQGPATWDQHRASACWTSKPTCVWRLTSMMQMVPVGHGRLRRHQMLLRRWTDQCKLASRWSGPARQGHIRSQRTMHWHYCRSCCCWLLTVQPGPVPRASIRGANQSMIVCTRLAASFPLDAGSESCEQNILLAPAEIMC